MKFGVCGGAERIAGTARSGFSYLEPSMAKVRAFSDGELDDLRRQAESAGLTIDGFNCFFNSSVDLYGEGAEERAASFARRNFEVARRLGGVYCVVGSGKIRSIPDGVGRAAAEEHFVRLLDRMGTLAGEFGVRLAVEPLNRNETNFIHTLTDGIRICRRVGNPNVGCLLDFYHFFRNGEDLAELDELRRGELIHVHLARPNPDRGAPLPEDAPTLAAWAAKLKQIGYDGRISLECGFSPDFDTAIGDAAEQMRVFQ